MPAKPPTPPVAVSSPAHPEYAYGGAFMSLAARSRRSADIIIDLLRQRLPVASVADFGCALGTWLAAWRQAGVQDVLGVDGSYVDRHRLEIPLDLFHSCNLVEPIDLGRRFDLVESTEVAEHLPEAAARSFILSLVRHSDLVLFSASPPGQGGENHLNEQPYEYWRDRFAEHGYRMFDWIRPRIIGMAPVAYWYRYNLFLFASADAARSLASDIRACEIAPGAAVPDLSPWLFRMRKQIVRRLSPSLQTRISTAIARLG
jgi:hypothetical protein